MAFLVSGFLFWQLGKEEVVVNLYLIVKGKPTYHQRV